MDLIRPGWMSKDYVKAQKSFDKIKDDDSKYYLVAQEARLPEIQLQAIRKITNQDYLKKMAHMLSLPDELKIAAITRITDQEFLMGYVGLGGTTRLRMAALHHVTAPLELQRMLSTWDFYSDDEGDFSFYLELFKRASSMEDIVAAVSKKSNCTGRLPKKNCFDSALKFLTEPFLFQLLSIFNAEFRKIKYPQKGHREREKFVIQHLISLKNEDICKKLILFLTEEFSMEEAGLNLHDLICKAVEALNDLNASDETEDVLLRLLSTHSSYIEIRFHIANVFLKSKSFERQNMAKKIIVEKRKHDAEIIRNSTLFCSKCRKRVSYEYRDTAIGSIAYCDECGSCIEFYD